MSEPNFGLCSLEDDGNELFLTQRSASDRDALDLPLGEQEACGSKSSKESLNSGEDSLFVGYSDISDAEDDFENPVYGRSNR